MEKELKLLFLAGMHTMICSGREIAGKGRFRFLPIPYGSENCVCHKMTLRYNGEIIQQGA